MLNLTKHAKVRMQQRRIDPLTVDLLLRYGTEEHDHRGAIRLFFNNSSRKDLRKHIGRQTYKRLEHCWDAYCVESDGQIVTVGWRY